MVGKKITVGWLIRTLILWFIVFIMLFPLIHMISVSLSDTASVMRGQVSFWPKGFNLEVYKKILSDEMIYTAYKNTLMYVIFGTAISLFVLVTGSYALSKKRCPFGKQINILILITMFFGGGMIPAYLALKWLHMLDTMWAVILPSALTAYNLIIMRSFFAQYPAEIEESGKLDGLNDIGVLWYLVLPTSTAVLATIGLFCAVSYWNSFMAPLLYLSDNKKYPLQIILRQIVMQSITESQGGTGETMKGTQFAEDAIKYGTILVSIIPIIAVYPFLQKYFVKGVMIGSVKG